ncbi:hypothetical protein IFM5058_08892 [Aspergillus udagawae]|nr:hypothetical protein IFM5058_08892 [Aspergillus udagawae]
MDSSDGSLAATLTPLTLRPSVAASTESPIAHRAMALIAAGTAIELTELSDETAFSSIRVDSLLSLALVEAEFHLDCRNSLFVDCPTIGDLKALLIDYCWLTRCSFFLWRAARPAVRIAVLWSE